MEAPMERGVCFSGVSRPEAAFISVGAGNSYNHPAEETIMRLEDAGALIFRTDFDGTIIVRTDGMTFSVETAKQGTYPFPDNSPCAAPA